MSYNDKINIDDEFHQKLNEVNKPFRQYQERMDDINRPLRELQEQITKRTKPIRGLNEEIEKYSFLNNPALKEFNNSMEDYRKSINILTNGVTQTLKQFAIASAEQTELLSAIGRNFSESVSIISKWLISNKSRQYEWFVLFSKRYC
ncbi:MAG: hypothetical protein FWE25_09015 [Lachnospiraceae bacterium]|nr:hypothetical protein [Lachnospiraceae bacterium]